MFELSSFSSGAEGWLGGRHFGRVELKRQCSVVVKYSVM